jgi:acetyl-CoA carboxylase biotin carboxylase subunit
VTESVTGVDLVKEQILVASGKPLSLRQQDVRIDGWAIECRINAEDPTDDFRPSPGRIAEWFPPGGIGVRLDSHAYKGYEVSPWYDGLVGKLIVKRRNREEAVAAMRNALSEFVIEGVRTTIPLYLEVLANVHFLRGNYDTGFIDEFFTR